MNLKSKLASIAIAAALIPGVGLFGASSANASKVHASSCSGASCVYQGTIWFYSIGEAAYAAPQTTNNNVMRFDYGMGTNEKWYAYEDTNTDYWYFESPLVDEWIGPNSGFSGYPITATASGPGNDEEFLISCLTGHEFSMSAIATSAPVIISTTNLYAYATPGGSTASILEAFDSNGDPVFC